MYIALLNHPDRRPTTTCRSLRVGVSGGAPIPAEVLDAFERKFGVVILEGYGLSETRLDHDVQRQRRASARSTASASRSGASRCRSGTTHDRPLPPGRDNVGELVIRGVNVMRGYHDNPEATAEAFAGGWFHTGDLGYVDEDGFFFIVDRKKELIIRGGYNVYPREVEEVLYAHPAVAEAAVVGVPDERLGEEVKAFVALQAGRRAHRGGARSSTSRSGSRRTSTRGSVEFRDELPKGPTGKILKTELKADRVPAPR